MMTAVRNVWSVMAIPSVDLRIVIPRGFINIGSSGVFSPFICCSRREQAVFARCSQSTATLEMGTAAVCVYMEMSPCPRIATS